jgi:serine/threonine-protein kinase
MSLAAGARLGPYEIVSPLGAGGMGDVYRARDTRLNRTVAIKILTDTLAGDAQFKERFEREARTISQLTHANICTLYDVGEHESSMFLVLEYLEGDTLAGRIAALGAKGKRLSIDEVLAIAIQIADGLSAAHASGIVHRDLKPGNVMLTAGGAGSSGSAQAKLLDFGLAKSAGRVPGLPGTAAPAIELAALSAPMTMTSPLTSQGAIVGTVQYMAPEQLEGKEADARSDIFAFGAVVYEMLTGGRAFQGKTLVSVMASILEHEPRLPISGDGAVPAALVRVVEKCLAKEPNRRWQSAADLADELRWIASEMHTDRERGGASAATGADAPGKRTRYSSWIVAVSSLAVGVALTASATWIVRRLSPARAPAPVRFTIVPPPAQALAFQGADRDIAVSADGSHVVYRTAAAATVGLAVRSLGELEPRVLSGLTQVRSPTISPDGRWVAFFSGFELKKISITGGPAVTLCSFQGAPRGASWGDNDEIVFASSASGTGLRAVAAGGGDPKVITKADAYQIFPSVLPGGQAVLFTITSDVNTSENSQIAVVDRRTGRQKLLVPGGSQPEYVDPGYLIYAVSGTLRAIRFDLERLEVVGDAIPVVEQVMMSATGAANYAVSRNGTLVVVPGGPASAARSLVWVDRQGREEAIKAPIRSYTFLRLSPDGARAALDIRDQERDVWVWDFARETMTRLTFGPALDAAPVWTPDGRRIAFQSTRAEGGAPNIFWQAADGTGAVERLTKSTNAQGPNAFSPDGTRLVFTETTPKTGIDVRMLDLTSSTGPASDDRPAQTIVQTTFQEGNADVSPDGNWIAYQSNESGNLQVYVRPFPKTDGGRWQVSTGGGGRPVWARNGRELFYIDTDNRLNVVPVRATPTFSAGSPVRVFDARYFSNIAGRTYDVSPDGRRFLMIKDNAVADGASSKPANLIVVEHWPEELKARLSPE